MRLTVLRSLAHSVCVLLLAAAALAAGRPHYGGVLRVETGDTFTGAENPVHALVCETLTAVDDHGQTGPKLATNWEAQSGDRRWQFWLRHDVQFHDGAPLTAGAVVASLTSTKGETYPWSSLRAVGDSVVFEFAEARPRFAAELAMPRYAVERANPGGAAFGTGPYRWGEARAGTFVLQANENYWGGRPFLDAIEVTQSRSPRDLLIDLDLGRADIVEVSPGQLRRITHARTLESQPADLMALTVRSGKPALQDARVRQAIAFSADRAAIFDVLLQKQGEIAGGLLPNWLSGYAFLFSPARDLARAQQLVREVGGVPPLTLAVTEPDPVTQLIAERIALNAHDAGITLQVTADTEHADLVLVRQGLASMDAEVALSALCEQFGCQTRERAAQPSAQARYDDERSMVTEAKVIPLAFVPRAYAYGPRVQDWAVAPDGNWRLDDVWLAGQGEGK